MQQLTLPGVIDAQALRHTRRTRESRAADEAARYRAALAPRNAQADPGEHDGAPKADDGTPEARFGGRATDTPRGTARGAGDPHWGRRTPDTGLFAAALRAGGPVGMSRRPFALFGPGALEELLWRTWSRPEPVAVLARRIA